MARKQPWFPWYADDWLSDEGLRACSLAARGLWIDMLSLMHKCDRRGYLQLLGKPLTLDQLARMTGSSTADLSPLVAELLNSGVASALDDGTIYSRRMVRDQQKRDKCAAAGLKGGGNPALKSGTTATFKGGPKGGPKGGDKGGLKGAYGSVSSFDPVLDLYPKEEKDSSGVGGAGGGATFKGTDKGTDKGRRGLGADALDPEFDRFWRSYPNKDAQHKARLAWDELRPSAELVEVMLAAIERQKQTSQWRKRIIPHAATWLAECRWQDEGIEATDATAARASQTAAAQEEVERKMRERRRDQAELG